MKIAGGLLAIAALLALGASMTQLVLIGVLFVGIFLILEG